MIGLDEIQKALGQIAPYIHKTPLIHSNSLSLLSSAEVYLKLENLQKTGSFKVRGAFNKMLGLTDKNVIVASMGNHAQAVAFAAGKLGKRATIVMPENASLVKQDATRGYGADVVLKGERLSDALAYALAQKDAVFIHPFDDDDVIAGQGTIGLEIHEELKDIDAIFVPVGGGGLIAGVATAIKALSPGTTVIGVQSECAQSACISFMEGAIRDREPATTIADGIAVGRLGERTFELISRSVDELVPAGEDAIARAILLLLERKKLVVEGAGAVSLAGLLDRKDQFTGKRVVLVLSGGNIDFTLMDRIILKGLVTSSRIGIFDVLVEDISGALHTVTGLIATARANILGVTHDRLAGDVPIGNARVTFMVEIRGKEHLAGILSLLREKGYEVHVGRSE